ncbi:YfhO family protein [Streptomyces sp. NBC_00237]|uniref:YfhO family protein n=1 Tax=Streptomyces sp. NBC_00237 TaxID=2975687 RepID=UPI002253F0A6|nr:YfhO family protein [Streptomyces sp. NBC_00237]MCX5200755.1 YfhO family protein [Streptomyces sp. NBC_00237]
MLNRPWPARPRFRPVPASALLAAAVAAFAHCLGSALAGSQPFGAMNRNVNDLGTQFVPFHAHLWDVLHGRADGGWLINWQSGYGSSFLPDVGTYLSSPFSFLVALFPREEIDLAVYVTSVLRIATAAAVMAWLLLRLRPAGRWWLAGTLGAAYALCGWSVIEASYNPMWLDGLIAFPLLCGVGEAIRAGRRPVAWFFGGTVLVAVVWVANFYTAYMATLGAGLVLVARLLMDKGDGRARLRVAGKACAVVALGIGLSAPVLLTVFAGTKLAYPGMGLTFQSAGWADVVGRLLPATYSFRSPAMYVSSAVLVLACALPFHRGLAVRVRVGWTVLAVAVLVSMQWGPTHLAWHAFAEPNGSPYRQTFVLSGVLVMAAWVAVGKGALGRQALVGGVGSVLVVGVVGLGSAFTGRWAWVGLGAGLVGVVGALVLLGRAGSGRGRRTYVVAAAVLLIGCTVGQSALTTAWAAKRRVAAQDDHAPYGPRQVAQSATIAGVDGWPSYRTEPGRMQTVHNDAMVVGGQGASYYSSLTSAALTRTLSALGDGWSGSGRAPHSLDNPVTDAVWGVGARLRSTYRKGADTAFQVVRREAAPLVTVRGSLPEGVGYGRSAFSNQELLVGAEVYERLPEVREQPPAGAGVRVVGPGARGPVVGAGVRATSGTCTPGAPVYVWAPGLNGTARLSLADSASASASASAGPDVGFESKRGRVRAAMQQVGVAPANGRVRVELRGRGARGAEVACLREDRLTAAVEALRGAGAGAAEFGDGSIRVDVSGVGAGGVGAAGVGAAGRVAVVAVPRIAGWGCAVDGGERTPADAYLGMLAVPLAPGAREVNCTFRPPGLRAGLVVGAGAGGVLVGVGVAVWVRRRGADASLSEGAGAVSASARAFA